MTHTDHHAWRDSLVETIRWCSARPPGLSPADRFRSPELSPIQFLRDPEQLKYFGEQHSGCVVREETDVVLRVAERRAELVRAGGFVPADLLSGRIAVFDFSSSLCDGLAQTDTDGFVDRCDCPGWDCWIGVASSDGMRFGDSLLYWLPAEHCDVVAAVDGVSCTGTTQWLSKRTDIPLELRDLFRHLGIA